MRYIGNKTKLLDFIGSVIDRLGIKPGRAADPFAGTASVARYLKSRGFATDCCDIMSYSYAFQRAYVELDAVPTFERVLKEDPDLAAVARRQDFQEAVASRFGEQRDLFLRSRAGPLAALGRILVYLDTFLPPLSSFVTREYSAEDDAETEGAAGDGAKGTDNVGSKSCARRFFTTSNAARIDAIRTRLHEWRTQDLLTADEFYLLLSCLVEAADRVANTTGIYAAFVKSWQPNALKPLRLQVPELTTDTGLRCRATQQDANTFVRTLGPVDLVYLDPPYNTRQYVSYYHVPELIVEGWFDRQPAVRGKTGLLPDGHKKSCWSVAGECVADRKSVV